MKAKAFAVIDGDPMAVKFGDRVGRARVEGRVLVLSRLLNQTEHFRGRGLIESSVRLFGAHRLEQIRHADGGDVGGEHRLAPGRGDEGLGRKIVNLVRPRFLDGAHEGREIAEIAVDQGHPAGDAEPTQPMIFDAPMRRSANDAKDFVAFLDKQM